MKNALLLSVFLFVCSFLGFAQSQPDFKKIGAPLPPFVIAKTAGGTFSNAQLKAGKPVMLMIFSPQCDHCEHMIDSIKHISYQFKETQLVLVAEDRNKDYMVDFVKKTGILSAPLFKNIGTDKGNLIYYTYTNKILPQVNIYDEKHRLVKTLDGNFPMDSLKMYIK